MPSPTKSELLAENKRLSKRIASLERAKKKCAAQAQEVEKLRADLLATAQRQAATAEILKVIAESPSDVQPVFDAIAERAAALCSAKFAYVTTFDGKLVHLQATYGPGSDEHRARYPLKPGSHSIGTRVVRDGAPVCVEDVLADTEYSHKAEAVATGFRSAFGVPMMRDGRVLGAISLARPEPGPIQQELIHLLQTFADQAVIAIENVRLFNETKEALEQQTASSEILGVISSSPTDLAPVFDAILGGATRLCDAHLGVLNLFDGENFRTVAQRGGTPEFVKWVFGRGTFKFSAQAMAKVVEERRPIQIVDAMDSPQYIERSPQVVGFVELGGARAYLSVPLVKEDKVVGAIAIYRPEARPFTDKQVELVKTFAAQAVIAIENVRLFNETKESLEQQTAISEILRVISNSPSDVRPVLEAVAERAARICEAQVSDIVLNEGPTMRVNASTGSFGRPSAAESMPCDRSSVMGRSIVDRSIIHIPDLQDEAHEAEFSFGRKLAQKYGHRTILAVPLVREDRVLGTIVLRRKEVRPFEDKHIALLRTFAHQAAIAIENVRLFNETKEALEHQRASAEILAVISSSVADTKPVFDKIADSAALLFSGRHVGIVLLEEDGLIHLAAHRGPAAEAFAGQFPVVPTSASVIFGRRAVQYPDVFNDPDVPPRTRANCEITGAKAVMQCPMISKGAGIGLLYVAREYVGAFSDKEMALLKTFADQAVIAIENVRLFKELESRTAALSQSVDQLTALGEVGQAISSTLDLETVLKTIVSRAVQLTGLHGGAIYEYDEQKQEFRLQISESLSEALVEVARTEPIRLGNGAVGLTGVTREPTQVPDTLADSYQSERKEMLIGAGYRAVLAVPLLREDNLLGALLVTRKAPGLFPDETVALLKTFATQSAMAIQNARLFREIAEKGKQLEIASHHKSDFLASMSHELRTPLNAILGFNELILAEIYGTVPEEMKEPLTDIQTSGKHLLRLINNVLDLAKIEAGRMELALAEYSVHDTVESVRSTLRPLAAEKGLEFHASVPGDIPTAYGDFGRITQCLMNLAGNSLKFTKAGKVEIVVDLNGDILVYRVNDTGIGIPPDKIGSLFTEFKQTDATIASEYGGTGLGLSISRQFIEMHGGRVWVESEVGKGSSFIFEVPLRVSRGTQS